MILLTISKQLIVKSHSFKSHLSKNGRKYACVEAGKKRFEQQNSCPKSMIARIMPQHQNPPSGLRFHPSVMSTLYSFFCRLSPSPLLVHAWGKSDHILVSGPTMVNVLTIGSPNAFLRWRHVTTFTCLAARRESTALVRSVLSRRGGGCGC